jgi:prepilin-type processing-associated H-X9-DG protein
MEANFTDWPNNNAFQSRHPGGLSFCMADGSVRWVNDTININVYRWLATIQGAETLPPEF